MGWFVLVLKRYAQFDGRAHRTEFWWFTLWSFVISLALAVLELALGIGYEYWGPLTSLYALAVFIPTLAVGSRRLHDIGRSGWWQLIMLIPLIGIILLIVWWATAGEQSENAYGPDPWQQSQPTGWGF